MAKRKPKPSLQITIEQYLATYGLGINVYSRSFLVSRFHGIMKSKEEWNEEVQSFMEGKK